MWPGLAAGNPSRTDLDASARASELRTDEARSPRSEASARIRLALGASDLRLVRCNVIPGSESLATGTLVKVASGSDDTAPISIRQRNAELWAGHLPAGTTIDVPVAPHVHVFVATGEAALADHTLRRGDAVRLTDENAHTLRVARDGTDVLIWATA